MSRTNAIDLPEELAVILAMVQFVYEGRYEYMLSPVSELLRQAGQGIGEAAPKAEHGARRRTKH
jgi:hypothetical protein